MDCLKDQPMVLALAAPGGCAAGSPQARGLPKKRVLSFLYIPTVTLEALTVTLEAHTVTAPSSIASAGAGQPSVTSSQRCPQGPMVDPNGDPIKGLRTYSEKGQAPGLQYVRTGWMFADVLVQLRIALSLWNETTEFQESLHAESPPQNLQAPDACAKSMAMS